MTFETAFAEAQPGVLTNDNLSILQVNVGRVCNLGCRHCHLSCGPDRQECMSRSTMEQVVAVVAENRFSLVDITGGAPELNRELPFLVESLHAVGASIQVRTNLVALLESGGLIEFFQERKVQLVASLPCYLEENVNAQRGDGVYEKSISCLLRLNAGGYGLKGGIPLALVYNPGGAFLPGSQAGLEAAYREELMTRYGIQFTRLYAITNMPLGRCADEFIRSGDDEEYLALLRRSFNPATLEGLMCRHQICVDWDGKLYDCDFNLALGMTVNGGAPDHIVNFEAGALKGRKVVTGEHCFGCTAGTGSSCGGSLAQGDE